MTKFTVIGAGMAGLFAAAVLREECISVEESQSELPNNHSAVLRFRSSIIGDTLNIPFKSVNVIKAVQSLGNPVADAVSYSLKTNGRATLRSIVSAQGKIEERFIAPPDFIERMSRKVVCPINFNSKWAPFETGNMLSPTISTIPMPILMKLLEYEHAPEFGYVNGYSCNLELRDTDLCATIYIPDPTQNAYRASITGSRLIIEYAFPRATKEQTADMMKVLTDYPSNAMNHILKILQLFGMDKRQIVLKPEFKAQQYAKILPIDDNVRKRFILWASEHHNIYSFGRFATWRPSLLMDDLVQDLRVIQRLVNGESKYNAVK